jgi:hypothetical protein
MVSAIGSGSVPALEGQIRQDQIQLNDWTTCVSAKTVKGQAAIRKLSGEISAAKEQMARALQTQAGSPSATSAAARRPGALDVWA